MDNFLTRLVKRTLGLMPVVQPMIASIFAPKEVTFDSYSSGFAVENNITELFGTGENVASLSLGLPVRLPINFPEKPSILFENPLSDSSIFAPSITFANNQLTFNTYPNEITQSISNQIDNRENYSVRSKLNNDNQSLLTHNSNPELSQQPNALSTVSPNYSKEVTPSQKTSESNLDRVELLKQEIETERQIEIQSLNVGVGRSQLETNPQPKDISHPISTNDVFRRENPLTRIKSLIDRVFQTQQQQNNHFSSPHDRVKLPANSLLSNLSTENTLKNTNTKVPSLQPIASEVIAVYENIENSTLQTDRLKIDNLIQQVKTPNVPNSQVTKLLLVDSDTGKTFQSAKNMTVNEVTLAFETPQITNLNQPQNYPKVINLSLNQQDNLIAKSKTSNCQQTSTLAEINLVNQGSSQEQLIQLVPQPLINAIHSSAERINDRQNNQTPLLSTSQLEQPVGLIVESDENTIQNQRKYLRLENKSNTETKAYANSTPENNLIFQSRSGLVDSQQKNKIESSISPAPLKAKKQDSSNDKFAFLTRRSLSVLSLSSEKEASINPRKNLPELRELNLTKRQEIAKIDRRNWQSIIDTETTIQITIGRVEVRANNQPVSSSPRTKSTQREPKLSLQDYLKQRQGEK